MHRFGKWEKPLFAVILIVVSILSFCAILIPREITFLKTISVLARYNTTRFVPVVALLLLGALSIKNTKLSALLSTFLIFSSFALVLNGLWAGAYSENNVVAGLIPRTDAFSFYTGSVSLKESGYLVSYTKRRPLFGSLLALLLWISKGNLQFSLAAITFLITAASAYSVLKVRKSLNAPAAVVYFFVIFFFCRRIIGITMSESIGVLLGISSLTFFLIFLRSSSRFPKPKFWYFLTACFLFTLAQAARPGALATVPLFTLLAGFIFRGKGKFSWKHLLITTAIILLCFGLNNAIYTATTLPGGTQTNNFGFGLYGLAVGGKGWEQIFYDHPEINLLSPDAFEKEVMRLIWHEISSNPFNFVQGMIVQLKTLFSFRPYNSLYSFVWSNNKVINYSLISLFFILSFTGITSAVIDRKKEIGIFTITLFLGFMGSLFIAPAYQTRYMRVYAASIPLLGFLPAYGLFFISRFLPEKFRNLFCMCESENQHQPIGALLFTSSLVLVLVVSPFILGIIPRPPLPQSPGCESDQDEAIVAYYPGSSIHILRNDPSIMTWVPILTQLDYKGSIHNICCEDEILYFENIPAPNILYPALNLLTDKEMYMIVEETLLPNEYGLLHICGRIEDVHGEPAEKGFLYPYTTQILR